MNLKQLLGIFLLLSLLISCDTKETKTKSSPMNEDGQTEKAIELANMQTSIAPGNDFFEYLNGGWMAKNPIPAEYGQYGAFTVLDKRSKEQIKTIVEEICKTENLEKGSPEQQIKDFYNAGMDTIKIEELGYQPIVPLLEKADGLTTPEDLLNITVELNKIGIYTSFYLFAAIDDKDATRYIPNLNQGGLGLPDRDYYLGTDSFSTMIQENYRNYIKNMFVLTGTDEATASENSQKIYNIEKQLAEASMSRLEQRDPNAVYNIFTMEDIEKNCKNFQMADYIRMMGLANITEINVRQPNFFIEFDKMVENIPMSDWVTFIKWKIINNTAGLLNQAIVDESFHFYGTILSGITQQEERWKKMISRTNGSLGEAVGQKYVEKHFPAEAKEKMLALVQNLRAALKESITNLDWMSDATKTKALEKLDAMNLKVGYPNKWKDYSSIDIVADNFVQNTLNANAFEVADNLLKIGKPIDKEEWGMNPQTVNAYYDPNRNEIVFPAAILQPPFFSLEADDAVNYGGIGVVIGHEMTHGFDDQGRQYDKDGNLSDWWTEEDADKFKAKTQLLIDQFNNYVILDSLHVNGELTLGENIADNGGLFISYRAMEMANPEPPADIDGLTYKQRFFISYAQVWRQNIRDKELVRRLKEDVHSPGEARVNAGVVNVPYWYEAFDITENDKLYVAPESRAKIW